MLTTDGYFRRRSKSLSALDTDIARMTQFASQSDAVNDTDFWEAIERLQLSLDAAAQQLRELAFDCGPEREVRATERSVAGVEHAWGEMREAVLGAIAVTYGNSEVRGSVND